MADYYDKEGNPLTEAEWDSLRERRAEPQAAYRCTECHEVQDESTGPIYECSECGDAFTREESIDGMSHRCPDCGRFGAKQASDSIDCGCNAEAEEVLAYQCEACDTLVLEDEAEEHQCGEEQEGEVAQIGPSMKEALVVGDMVHIKPSKYGPVHPFHIWPEVVVDQAMPERPKPCFGPGMVIAPAADLVMGWVIQCPSHGVKGTFRADHLEKVEQPEKGE